MFSSRPENLKTAAPRNPPSRHSEQRCYRIAEILGWACLRRIRPPASHSTSSVTPSLPFPASATVSSELETGAILGAMRDG